jgi:hypothetical protein
MTTLDDNDTGMVRPKKTGGPAVVVAFRLPQDLLDRLDRYAADMGTTVMPGLDFSRTDAVRQILTRALDEWEKGREGR